jgi:hypothetical protein
MTNDIRPLHSVLSGENAFYSQVDYYDRVLEETSRPNTLDEISYVYKSPASEQEGQSHRASSTDSKIISISKQIFGFIPSKIYAAIDRLVSSFVLPASLPEPLYFLAGHSAQRILRMRGRFGKDSIPRDRRPLMSMENVSKRITVSVDGVSIDAMVSGKISNLANGRWILRANGNNDFYEYTRPFSEMSAFVANKKFNILMYNYPGVGASEGVPSKEMMVKTHRAMLTFLEDSQNGVGAKSIIDIGHSIGGGVQGEALKKHELKKDIDYVFIKNKTFSQLSKVPDFISGAILRFFGWEMDSVESSKNLTRKEIIVQSADVQRIRNIGCDESLLKDDDVIFPESSLAYALLNDPDCPKENKKFLGTPTMHAEIEMDLFNISYNHLDCNWQL